MEEEVLKERWKVIRFKDIGWVPNKYKVSNWGRIKCVERTRCYPTGRLVKTGKKERYPRFRIKKDGKSFSIAVHRLVAIHFLPQLDKTKNIIVHLDYNNFNNKVSNLKWVDEYEQRDHHIPEKYNPAIPIVTSYAEEQWGAIFFNENITNTEKFQVSTFGRVRKFCESNTWKMIRPSSTKDYLTIKLTQKNGKKTGLYIHRLVAACFMPQKDVNKTLVIHIDYNNANNHIDNLMWVNYVEKETHKTNNPKYKNNVRKTNAKLTEGRVRILKKKLLDPNRKTRMKMLSKQFGVSEMQLHRIKTGENWSHIKV